jgi:Type II secretion system (T2SS), protein M subtype b
MLLTRLINAPMRLQKSAAIALLLLSLAIAGMAGALSVDFMAGKRTVLIDLREKAGRLTQIVALKDSVKPSVDSSTEDGSHSLFLEAESLTIGRANLQGRIEAIAQSNGLLLSSAGGLPDLEEAGLKLIGLRVDLSGGYDAVHKAIVDLETSKPPLMIRELALRLASGEAGDRPLELAAQIKIFGAFRLSSSGSDVPESGSQ